jgi:hypothetical protein
MIKHVVMWKMKHFGEGGYHEANAQRIKEDLEELKEKIKEIKSIEVGVNNNITRDSFDVVLVAEFNSLDDLKAYQSHPAHLKAAEYITKVTLLRKVVDYEL